MKKIILLLLFSGLLSAHAGFVYRTGSSFLTTADLDGDGRSDLVLVDGSNATVRVAYQLSITNFTWAAARPLGLDEVTDIDCGKVFSLTKEVLVATSPLLNRYNFYELTSAAQFPFPVAGYALGTGPESLVLMDIGGGGNTAHDDLLSISVLNGTAPYQATRVRSDGSSVSMIGRNGIGSNWRQLNEVEYATGLRAVGIIDGANNLRLYSLVSGSLSQVDYIALGLSNQPNYVSFIPQGLNYARFLTWEQGSSILKVIGVSEPVAGTFNLGVDDLYDLGAPITSVQLVTAAGVVRLAVVFNEGQFMELYDYDGSGAPTLIQQWVPPQNESFIGLLPAGTDHLVALSSASGDFSGSVTADQQHFSGGQFSSVGTTVLPAPAPSGGAANVMTFVGEPFVDSTPQRLQLLRAGDWSDSVSLGPNVAVKYETDQGWQQGLGNKQTTVLGSATPGAAYSLDNQLHEAISVHSFDAARGEEVVLISVSPEPGTYGTSVEVSFSSTPVGTVYYRTDPSHGWSASAAAFTLFADADVQYFAETGGKRSIIRTASFRFSDAPSDLDSDGDEVPDYVELANGLDPVGSGLDSDGDGFSDLDELLAGSDPTNAASLPVGGNRFERSAIYDLELAVLGYDGVVNSPKKSHVGTQVRLFSASGSQAAYTEVEGFYNGPVLTNTAARFDAVSLSVQPPFVTAITEAAFQLLQGSSSNPRGVELIGVYLQPTPDTTSVNYIYQGGSLATEANNWIAAALNVYTNQPRELQADDLSITNTLSSMLIERKLADLLVERGSLTNGWVSLFKGRPGDTPMLGLAGADLQALEKQGPSGEAAYHLPTLISSLQSAAASMPTLTALTQDLYDIRSYYGRFPSNVGKYPLPADVLRELLYSGTMHSNYLAHAQITPAEVSAAYAEATNLFAQVLARPIANFMLEVRADSFDATCPVLYTGGNVAKSLYTAEGRPFNFPATFTLQPGAQVSLEAFTDLDWNLCPGTDPLEVISLALTAVPTASGADADGNLLPDDYEEMFLVGSGGLATSDLDGDGFSDLQEYLDGTDPNSSASFGGSGPVDLSPPFIWMQSGLLSINWPPSYAEAFIFTVEYTEDLPGTPFVDVQVLPQGALDAPLDQSATARFYRVKMQLR